MNKEHNRTKLDLVFFTFSFARDVAMRRKRWADLAKIVKERAGRGGCEGRMGGRGKGGRGGRGGISYAMSLPFHVDAC